MTRKQLAENVVGYATRVVMRKRYYGFHFWLDGLKDDIRLLILTDAVDRPAGYYYKKAIWMAKNPSIECNTLKRKANFDVTYTDEPPKYQRQLDAFRLRALAELGESLTDQLLGVLSANKPNKTQLALLQTQRIRDFLEEEII